MHIPDGFVSTPLNLLAAATSMVVIGAALTRARRSVAERPHVVPLLATTAAFVFAAQMLNFPIGGGTSGHFLGAVTAAALLGPWNACLVMAIVLVIQGFFFADGGITALGTNIFNMGVIGGIGGYILMRVIRSLLRPGMGSLVASAAIASWASVVLASSFCALELAVSGTSPISVAFPAMAGTHAIIGIGEALITSAVLSAVAASRPDLLPDRAGRGSEASRAPSSGRRVGASVLAGLAVTLAVAMFASPFASVYPDGLERVAENAGFIDRSAEEDELLWSDSPFPDYSVGSIDDAATSTGLAGLFGTAAVFGAGFVAIKLTKGRKRT